MWRPIICPSDVHFFSSARTVSKVQGLSEGALKTIIGAFGNASGGIRGCRFFRSNVGAVRSSGEKGGGEEAQSDERK